MIPKKGDEKRTRRKHLPVDKKNFIPLSERVIVMRRSGFWNLPIYKQEPAKYRYAANSYNHDHPFQYTDIRAR